MITLEQQYKERMIAAEKHIAVLQEMLDRVHYIAQVNIPDTQLEPSGVEQMELAARVLFQSQREYREYRVEFTSNRATESNMKIVG